MAGSGRFAPFNAVGAHPCVRPYNTDKEKIKKKREKGGHMGPPLRRGRKGN